MEKEVLELPITGLHMSYGAVKLLYHKPLQKIEQRWKIDHEAYKAQFDAARKLNFATWSESDTKLPAEIYSQYRIAKGIESFRSLSEEYANFKVRDRTTGNSFWAQDVAQIVQGLGRMVDRAELEKVVVEVSERYTSEWKRQLSAFGTGKVRKISDKRFDVYEKSQAVEQYNKFMKLMYVFPTISAAAEFNKTVASNIDDAAKRHRELNECYFRYYYDNSFVALGNCMCEQIFDGEVINRFISIKEASTALDMPTYTVYRLLRNPTSTDKYGCTWRKIAKN